ncbi:MAG: 16S rRNA (uracil(1498)-N(3))-methyltransferase [Chloroflexota bacterium]|nr:16S rRNA (uracil(1498)-N(3))-methyltransferase [Chloroflexota bacterium]MDQ5868033.1 16S rRNA (uracil(1498)-N(3))-methyltransferase [Chloroflexota bacterium]
MSGMHRFYVPHIRPRDGNIQLTGPTYEQIRRVLRMRPGDHIAVFDGSGREYHLTLAEFGKGEVYGHIVEQYEVATEPQCQVVMYLSLLNKSEKFEWALQKCTELGASQFVPVVAARSVTAAARSERWERIIQEAVEQSGRGILPTLAMPVPFQQAVRQAVEQTSTPGLVLLPEVTGERSLSEVLASTTYAAGTIALFIGPEGGFSPEEQEFAREQGVQVVKMGSRILRAETAAVAALTVTMDRLGELQ